MKVRVLKETEGRVSLMVISEARPPLPPVLIVGLKAGDVAERCLVVIDEMGRARALARPEKAE